MRDSVETFPLLQYRAQVIMLSFWTWTCLNGLLWSLNFSNKIKKKSPVRIVHCSVILFQTVVPSRVLKMEEAIKNRDFESFAKLTCADSNQFHAVCLDTSPPIFLYEWYITQVCF
jgi:hypothetical protein